MTPCRAAILASVAGLSAPALAEPLFFVLKEDYLAFAANPEVVRYDSVSDFQNNQGGVVTTRSLAHGVSSDIAIDELGRFYFVNGDPTQTDSKTIYRWDSVADWAANTNGVLIGTRTTTTQVSGFSVHQGAFYFLEGDPNDLGTKSLVRWDSAATWAAGDAGTVVGSRATGYGLGFEIDGSGTVWLLDARALTATSGTLYSFASITAFLNNVGTDNGGSFDFFGGTDQIGGLAVAYTPVPEPSTFSLVALGFAGVALARRRRRA